VPFSREIGYDLASRIVRKVHPEGTTLKEATLKLKALAEERFDAIINAAYS